MTANGGIVTCTSQKKKNPLQTGIPVKQHHLTFPLYEGDACFILSMMTRAIRKIKQTTNQGRVSFGGTLNLMIDKNRFCMELSIDLSSSPILSATTDKHFSV